MKKILVKIVALAISALSLSFCLYGCNTDYDYGDIKNVIIIIGDGCGLEHIEAGELYEGESYAFKKWHKTTVNTDSINYGDLFVLTDSAAGGTAIATGTLTINGHVGVDKRRKELPTVMDIAKQIGKATGVVTTDVIYGATPGAFTGHTEDRGKCEELLISQFTTSNVDFMCGATDYFVFSKEELIEQNGYKFLYDFDDIYDAMDEEKLYWDVDIAGVTAEYGLNQVTEKALEFLGKDEDGFVLMIEQAHIDKYAHSRDISGVVESVKSLNDTVETVMEWIGSRKDTAVLITADHETGGLKVEKKKTSGMTAFPTEKGDDLYYSFSTTDHTKTPVGLFTYGIKPDFASFEHFKSNDIIKNIETNQIIVSLLNSVNTEE